jgi:RNA polymerase sigma factor (sigma-70 family)
MHITNDLLVRLNNNEPTAYNELFDATFSDLTLFVYRMTDDLEESKDIAITAIRKLLGKNLTFNAVAQLKSYLYKSVRNGALNYLKATKKEDPFQKQLRAETPTAEDPAIYKKHDLDHLRKVVEEGLRLGKLEKQVEAVIRLMMDNKELSEIAKTLNISLGQVYTQKSKGIKWLQKFVAENGDKYGIPVVIILLAILCKIYFS